MRQAPASSLRELMATFQSGTPATGGRRRRKRVVAGKSQDLDALRADEACPA
jgi:hypothetical protein